MRSRPLTLVLAVATACDGWPPVAEEPELPGSVVSGSVLIEDVEGDPAPTILLMSTEEDPQPPLGTGFPVTFAVIDEESYGTPGAGLLGAAYAFTGVPPGGYFIYGVYDADRNFHPEVSALQTASCGDHIGWHAADLDGTPSPVRVGAQDWADEVAVLLDTVVPGPPPVSRVVGSTELVIGERFRLEAVGVQGTFANTMVVDVPAPDSGAPCAAGFRFERVDADGDGEADDNPLLPLPLAEDRWPRVLLVYEGLPEDGDGDGVVDAYGVGSEPPENFVVALGDPEPADGAELPAPGEEVVLDALDVRFTGLALRILPDGTSEILGDGLPAGAWSILMITQEGQLWWLPNELEPRSAPGRALAPPGLTAGGATHQGTIMTYTP